MKVLVLTTIYPAPDIQIANNTNVVHYFAKEWVKQGHEVYVIHNYPIYMKIFHKIGALAEKTIASKFNTSVTAVYQKNDVEYEMDGVHVVRMPLFKPLPRFQVPHRILNLQINKMAEFCKSHNFSPDVITSHNFYPHLPMVNLLQEEYFPKAKTCVVVHKQVWKMLRYCGKDYETEINKVDIWGYRSLPLKREFEKNSGVIPKKWFMCYSGIPVHFLHANYTCNVAKPINRFVYVGSFIRRKFPEKLLLGIKESQLKDFSVDYVGDGVNRRIIEKLIDRNNWMDKVKLHGFVSRDKVPEFVGKAQCFVMISEEETFGLVYLEAMSIGCITIASKNEGMEGIIEDGVNGFLCKAGDESELAQIIDKINNMSQVEINQISQNAIATARKLTDSRVAKDYIESIVNA